MFILCLVSVFFVQISLVLIEVGTLLYLRSFGLSFVKLEEVAEVGYSIGEVWVELPWFYHLVGSWSTFGWDDAVEADSIFDLETNLWYQIINSLFLNHFLNLIFDVLLQLLMTAWVYPTLVQLYLLVQKRPHRSQRNGFAGELLPKYFQQEAVLLLGLRLDHWSSYCAAWLKEEDSCLLAAPWLWDGLVLMTPYNQVEEWRDLSVHQTLPSWSSKKQSLVLILVQHQNVEPCILFLPRPLKLYSLLLKGQVQPFITHVPNPEDSDFGWALLIKNWNDLYLLDVGDLSKVIHIMVAANLVQGAQHFQTDGVIMVSVNWENWKPDFQIVV